MKYPVSIKLRKLETREDAKHPQEDKYPSGSLLAMGLMWEHTLPEVGKEFFVMEGKMWPSFKTSIVEEIIEDTDEKILMRTMNSIYEIIIDKDIEDERED